MVPGHDGLEASQSRGQPDIFCRPREEKRAEAQLPLRCLVRQAVHQIDEAKFSLQCHPWPTKPDGEAVYEAKFSLQCNPGRKARLQLLEAKLTFWKLQQEVDQAKWSVRASGATGH